MKNLKNVFSKLKNYEFHFINLSKTDSIFCKMYAEMYFALKKFIEGKDNG